MTFPTNSHLASLAADDAVATWQGVSAVETCSIRQSSRVVTVTVDDAVFRLACWVGYDQSGLPGGSRRAGADCATAAGAARRARKCLAS